MTSRPPLDWSPLSVDPARMERIGQRLQRLYGPRADSCLHKLAAVIEQYRLDRSAPPGPAWDQRDVVLITYGDQVRQPDGPALPALDRFLAETQLSRWINTVHLLPFFPYSSDDGFSVIDYRQVDPAVGSWEDVRRLGQRVRLMFDLVLNHCSSQSRWFQAYLAGQPPYDHYFIEVDPDQDLSQVVRPRSTPLLTPVQTSRGTRHVWTTFSPDQVDLNFAEPDVLVEVMDILLFYVSQGARIIRLDAIAYLWKQLGTPCIHLPQTHEVVKLMRDVLDAVAPGTLLLTETNVPHKENISYFGQGDESHLVYQFSLPPLLLDAYLHEDARPLRSWLAGLQSGPPGTTFLNFTASHDGVGVRPLEGLVEPERIARLVDAIRQRGGLVSTRRDQNGRDAPYELNITYVDALGEPEGMDVQLHARRFLASQAIMLALPGIPGIYFHSLVGTRNDTEAVQQTGQPRRINRRKFMLDELRAAVSAAGSLQQRIFDGYQQLLAARVAHPAFHPDGPCRLLPAGSPALLALTRTSPDGSRQVTVVANFGSRRVEVLRSQLATDSPCRDLLSPRKLQAGQPLVLAPFEIVWLEPEQ